MLHETGKMIGKGSVMGKKLKKPLRRAVTYPTIGRDAERLGVSRPHLWMVLEGRRASESLMRRYAALKRMKEA
jgi:hypothetical protein